MAPPKTARTRSVGTKLAEEEYALPEAAAAKCGRTVGEWCCEELLHAAGDGNSTATVSPISSPADETLLAEILALRTILLNLFYDLTNDEAITPGRMQELIAKADGEKCEKALPRLAGLKPQVKEAAS